MEKTFQGKNVLITGGAGSIGSNIVRLLLNLGPNIIRVFDNNETALFNMQTELKNLGNVRFLVGDIRSKNRLERAMENIDIVFHAAALKHVPLCEYNPFEAVETNVVGTQNVIDAAMNKEVEKLISISTDKAVNPINTMGATKLLSEKLVTAANYYKGPRKTAFSSVRFGNVLASNGSVVPTFRKQIEAGGPVTLTDERMTRFFMSMDQAAALIFKATEMTQGGEVFIFKMPSIRMADLAEAMIEELSTKLGLEKGSIAIKKIGIRPGEKLNEDLISKEETANVVETDDMYIIVPQTFGFRMGKPFELPKEWNAREVPQSAKLDYSSGKNNISKEEIKRILRNEGLV
jgi:FlaA1/EpsC-like NDP-sugar epimerase